MKRVMGMCKSIHCGNTKSSFPNLYDKIEYDKFFKETLEYRLGRSIARLYLYRFL